MKHRYINRVKRIKMTVPESGLMNMNPGTKSGVWIAMIPDCIVAKVLT
jgi:hypothetical protein